MKKLCVLLGALSLMGSSAWAQDGGYAGGREDASMYGHGDAGMHGQSSAQGSVGERSASLHPSATAPEDKPRYSLGLGLASAPRYQGSDKTATGLSGIFSVEYGPFFLDSMRGLGARYSTPFGLHMSGALAYDPGRTEKDEGGNYWSSGGDELLGMGKVKTSATISVELSQDVTDWLALNMGGEFAVAGQKHRGNQYTAGLTLRPWTTETDQVEVGVSAHLGDEDYNRTYFGVTPEQALRSRYGQFDAESGLYASSVEAKWMHMIDEHWATLAAGEYRQYSSKIKKSPIVRDSSGVIAVVGVRYIF